MTVGVGCGNLAFGSALAVLALVIPTASAQADLVAPRDSCPAQQNIDAPEPKQELAMTCLIDYARGSTESHTALERAAGRKVGDVFDCGFSHTACGLAYDAYPKRYGYTSGTSGWKLGENLAWGKRKHGSARQIFKAWLDSPPHRATMLNGAFQHIGLGLKRGRFNGQSNSAVWALEIGCRDC